MSHHGTQTEATAPALNPAEGDTVIVFRSAYGRHEAWVWDRHVFARESVAGWVYLAQGTEAECMAAIEAAS